MTEDQLREQLLALPAEVRHRLGMEAVESAEAEGEADDGLTEAQQHAILKLVAHRQREVEEGRARLIPASQVFERLERMLHD